MKRRKITDTSEKRAVGAVVRKFVSSGDFVLSHPAVQGDWEPVKELARRNVSLVFSCLWEHLSSKKAKARFAALLMCDELFARSGEFRRLLCSRLMDFCDCVMGVDPEKALPDAAGVGGMLRAKAISCLRGW